MKRTMTTITVGASIALAGLLLPALAASASTHYSADEPLPAKVTSSSATSSAPVQQYSWATGFDSGSAGPGWLRENFLIKSQSLTDRTGSIEDNHPLTETYVRDAAGNASSAGLCGRGGGGWRPARPFRLRCRLPAAAPPSPRVPAPPAGSSSPFSLLPPLLPLLSSLPRRVPVVALSFSRPPRAVRVRSALARLRRRSPLAPGRCRAPCSPSGPAAARGGAPRRAPRCARARRLLPPAARPSRARPLARLPLAAARPRVCSPPRSPLLRVASPRLLSRPWPLPRSPSLFSRFSRRRVGARPAASWRSLPSRTALRSPFSGSMEKSTENRQQSRSPRRAVYSGCGRPAAGVIAVATLPLVSRSARPPRSLERQLRSMAGSTVTNTSPSTSAGTRRSGHRRDSPSRHVNNGTIHTPPRRAPSRLARLHLPPRGHSSITAPLAPILTPGTRLLTR